MRLLIITSNQLRHQYFAASLAKRFEVVGTILEVKKRDPATKGSDTPLAPAVRKYFSDRDQSEVNFFGKIDWSSVKKNLGEVREIEAGTLNDTANLSFVSSLRPDCAAVFGSSILGVDFINLIPVDRVINMHLGLSPYYRGSGTNFWPMYEERIEYVGVTVHYLDQGIDSGKIITQGRPLIEYGDTPHSIGNKTIEVGVELMIKVLEKIYRNEVVIGHKQELSLGKLYLFKDCTAEHIVELENKFKNGLVETYLKRKIAAPKLIEL